MSKNRSKEYVAFERMVDDLLSVPKAVLNERIKAHRERAALNPNKRGPKPKVTQPSDVSRDPAD